ncbi:MAG: phytanoyl-CoA dioxygenase family protein [Gammaproteobacteria bacterium]
MDSTLEIKTQETYLEQFSKEGVVVFKKLLNETSINFIKEELSHIRAAVFERIATMDRPLRTYSDIAERELGRLDYRCGFKSPMFEEIAQPIIHLIKQMSPQIDLRHYWGAIPSLGKSRPTAWHRDVYPILNNIEGQNLCEFDIDLPAYYFTVLIPLVNITEENGPTRFIKGTHKQMQVNVDEKEAFAPLVTPGDVTIFDGRILHKGSANQTDNERLVAYITFVAHWYHDQTFTINDYLFPELA